MYGIGWPLGALTVPAPKARTDLFTTLPVASLTSRGSPSPAFPPP
jgi:hypothetical protein